MRKRKRPRNNIDSVGVDMESYPNAIVVSKPNGDVMFFPSKIML